MNGSEQCRHGSVVPVDVLESLHDSQAGTGRHKCPNCAFQAGLEVGLSGKTIAGDVEECSKGSSTPHSLLKGLSDSQAGIGRHKCTNCAYQQGYKQGVSQRTKSVELLQVVPRSIGFPDVDDESIKGTEGARRWVQHLSRERDSKIVKAKKAETLKKSGCLKCEVCDFNFEEFYGELGQGFCEIHHKLALASAEEEVETKLSDLAILCSNCHRMIHRTIPMVSPEQLKFAIHS